MSHRPRPAGHVAGPLIILSFVALGLGFATEKMGIFDGANEALRGVWNERSLVIESETGLPGTVGILLTAFAVFGVVFSILGTPGEGRRAILGMSAVFLSVALLPCFAVWGIFWKPFGMILGVIWGWMSAAIYAHNHVMPCEISLSVAVENVVIPMNSDHAAESSSHADG